VKILPPRGDIGLKIGDTINNGHELTSSGGRSRSAGDRKSRRQFSIKLQSREEGLNPPREPGIAVQKRKDQLLLLRSWSRW
jgi:hypothetical protein